MEATSGENASGSIDIMRDIVTYPVAFKLKATDQNVQDQILNGDAGCATGFLASQGLSKILVNLTLGGPDHGPRMDCCTLVAEAFFLSLGNF